MPTRTAPLATNTTTPTPITSSARMGGVRSTVASAGVTVLEKNMSHETDRQVGMSIPTIVFTDPCVCPACVEPPIFDTDIHNELMDRIECDWGYEGCHVDGIKADMYFVDGGWMCTVCDAIARAEWEEYKQAQERGWGY